MTNALRLLLTLLTILCCATICNTNAQETVRGVVVEKTCFLEGETGSSTDFVAAKTSVSPTAFARSQQGTFPYTGVDRFRDITLKKGTIIYGGEPGQSAFYTTGSAFRRVGDSATDLWRGLQVKPHKARGYRSDITAYEVIDDVPAAFGRALNNSQISPGGLPQIVVPNYQQYLRPIHTSPLSP